GAGAAGGGGGGADDPPEERGGGGEGGRGAHTRHYCDVASPLLINEDGHAYTVSTDNRDTQWDYWLIGGRWGGFFPYKPQHAGLILKPETKWDSPDIKPGYYDGGPKKALDLAAMREARAVRARRRYTEYTDVVKGTPDPLPWRTFADNISPWTGYTLDQAREEYQSQPRIQALKGTAFDEPFGDDPAEEFGGEREGAQLARAR